MPRRGPLWASVSSSVTRACSGHCRVVRRLSQDSERVGCGQPQAWHRGRLQTWEFPFFLSLLPHPRGTQEARLRTPWGSSGYLTGKGGTAGMESRKRVMWCKACRLLSPVGSSNLEVDPGRYSWRWPFPGQWQDADLCSPAGACRPLHTEGLQPQYHVREPLVWPQECGSPGRSGQERKGGSGLPGALT